MNNRPAPRNEGAASRDRLPVFRGRHSGSGEGARLKPQALGLRQALPLWIGRAADSNPERQSLPQSQSLRLQSGGHGSFKVRSRQQAGVEAVEEKTELGTGDLIFLVQGTAVPTAERSRAGRTPRIDGVTHHPSGAAPVEHGDGPRPLSQERADGGEQLCYGAEYQSQWLALLLMRTVTEKGRTTTTRHHVVTRRPLESLDPIGFLCLRRLTGGSNPPALNARTARGTKTRAGSVP